MNIQILGPFNTGTNLIIIILHRLGLGERLGLVGDARRHLDRVDLRRMGDRLIWKHTIFKEKLEECIINNKNTLFICMYKPIYQWIESIKKESYNIKWNKDIYSKCCFDGELKTKREWNQFEYENIVELYNMYYLTYKYLIEKYNNVIWIDYYKLLDKENVEKYIEDKIPFLNIKDKQNIINDILNTPSKCHGASVKNSEEALKKKKIIDNNFEMSKDKKFIDNKLDKSIVDFYR